jgi:hypothetical protein
MAYTKTPNPDGSITVNYSDGSKTTYKPAFEERVTYQLAEVPDNPTLEDVMVFGTSFLTVLKNRAVKSQIPFFLRTVATAVVIKMLNFASQKTSGTNFL